MTTAEDPLTEKLRPHVEEIKHSAREGNDHAIAVIILYGMHISCPSDLGAVALCEQACEDWLRSVGKPTR